MCDNRESRIRDSTFHLQLTTHDSRFAIHDSWLLIARAAVVLFISRFLFVLGFVTRAKRRGGGAPWCGLAHALSVCVLSFSRKFTRFTNEFTQVKLRDPRLWIFAGFRGLRVSNSDYRSSRACADRTVSPTETESLALSGPRHLQSSITAGSTNGRPG